MSPELHSAIAIEFDAMTQYEAESRAAGLVEQKRYDEAQKLLYELAENGSVYASLTLGWLYEADEAARQNTRAARYFYERAASMGSPSAYWRLGSLLARENELVSARAAFRAGAEMGHLAAMYRLGNMLWEGEGGQKEREEGISWLERAAKLGHLFSEGQLISIEAEQSRSCAAKLSRTKRRIALMIKYAKEVRMNLHSEKFER